MATDYVPSREAAFEPWFNNLAEYVPARVLFRGRNRLAGRAAYRKEADMT